MVTLLDGLTSHGNFPAHNFAKIQGVLGEGYVDFTYTGGAIVEHTRDTPEDTLRYLFRLCEPLFEAVPKEKGYSGLRFVIDARSVEPWCTQSFTGWHTEETSVVTSSTPGLTTSLLTLPSGEGLRAVGRKEFATICAQAAIPFNPDHTINLEPETLTELGFGTWTAPAGQMLGLTGQLHGPSVNQTPRAKNRVFAHVTNE